MSGSDEHAPAVGEDVVERHAPHPLAGPPARATVLAVDAECVTIKWRGSGAEQRIPLDRIGMKMTDLVRVDERV